LSNDFASGSPNWKDGENEEDARTDTRRPLRYALLIDEINRADLARVFGELLYCIEYRGNNNTDKENTIALPHRLTSEIRSVFTEQKIDDPFDGGQRFYLPKNLYIVGTMNQADRSIGAFDAALRRRFAWYKLDFSVSRLQQMLEGKGKDLPEEFAKLLPEFIRRAHQLNHLIASGRSKIDGPKNTLPLSAEHCIGHTWFAEIVGILESQGHRNGQICTLHLERLWLYFLQPQLEDALGFEALNFEDQLTEMRVFFTKAL
jgi:5-methylcytosine-specific restriction protein B